MPSGCEGRGAAELISGGGKDAHLLADVALIGRDREGVAGLARESDPVVAVKFLPLIDGGSETVGIHDVGQGSD